VIGDAGISVGDEELVQWQPDHSAQGTHFQDQLLPLDALQEALVIDDGELLLQLERSSIADLGQQRLRLPEGLERQLLTGQLALRRQLTQLPGIQVAPEETDFIGLRHEIDTLQYGPVVVVGLGRRRWRGRRLRGR